MPRLLLLFLSVAIVSLVSIALAWTPSTNSPSAATRDSRAIPTETRRVLDLGDRALSETLRVMAHNLANINTSAFKTRYVTMDQVDIGAGGGCRCVIRTDFRQGDLTSTERPLDLAIQGRGFFQVMDDRGTLRYTRRGDFALNAVSTIVLRVEGREWMLDPPIMIPPDATAINVDHEGIVSVQQPGQTAKSQVGQIQLAMFVNVEGLKDVGGGLYEEKEESGAATLANPAIQGAGTICQHKLEASNVDFERTVTEYRETLSQLESLRALNGK